VKVLRILIITFLICQSWPSLAFNPANTYWMNLKPKLIKHLDNFINKAEYKYEIVGPTIEMKNFLGNRPDANIKFEKLILDNPSSRKTIIAVAYDENNKQIDSLVISIDVWVYRDVYMLKNSVSAKEDIKPENIFTSRIPIRQIDEKLYFTGNLKQKVAATSIPANTPLKINMVRHEKLIQVGDMINIKNENKFITLEFMCKAMSSGDVGDTITINCPDMQNKTMKAQVTGIGTAKLI
jgi:flagella basal body P-ring formation protein FlgA